MVGNQFLISGHINTHKTRVTKRGAANSHMQTLEKGGEERMRGKKKKRKRKKERKRREREKKRKRKKKKKKGGNLGVSGFKESDEMP